MIDSVFLHEFKERGSVQIGDWILWKKSLNLWNVKTDENIHFKTLDEAMGFEIDGKTIKQIVADADMSLFDSVLNGGSGAGSPKEKGKQKFKFGGNGQKPAYNPDIPVKVNTRVKTKTAAEAVKQFRNMHGNSKIEHAITIDKNGFVSGYTHGSSMAVVPPRANKGETLIHNHPGRSYGKTSHFSDADLLLTAKDKNLAGVVATFNGGYHNFQKGTHFKAEEFAKAVNKATFSGTDYDTAVTGWLRRNQKKYGYKYTLNLDKPVAKTKKTTRASTKTKAPEIKWNEKTGQGSLF